MAAAAAGAATVAASPGGARLCCRPWKLGSYVSVDGQRVQCDCARGAVALFCWFCDWRVCAFERKVEDEREG